LSASPKPPFPRHYMAVAEFQNPPANELKPWLNQWATPPIAPRNSFAVAVIMPSDYRFQRIYSTSPSTWNSLSAPPKQQLKTMWTCSCTASEPADQATTWPSTDCSSLIPPRTLSPPTWQSNNTPPSSLWAPSRAAERITWLPGSKWTIDL